MGWRAGQGIGPRLDRRSKKMDTSGDGGEDALGDALGAHAGGSAAGGKQPAASEAAFVPAGVTFAPRDVSIENLQPKADVFGIGYRGMSASDFNLGARARKGVTGFGVGALEEEDDDIYQEDSKVGVISADFVLSVCVLYV